jgi:hypothetical protein
MIRDTTEEKWERLEQKNVDTQFMHEIVNGLNCSPYEAQCVLDSVYRIYAPYFETNGVLKPGQMLFQVLSVDNAPSVLIAESKQITALLTMDDFQEDVAVRKKSGVIGLRKHRMQRVCTEAYQQGGVLTVEDLAYRLFNCGARTICRDLKELRATGVVVPLRSTIKDMGRTITHRSIIVEQWLSGKEYSEIGRSTFHSILSVKNYIDKFKRVIALSLELYDVHSTAFLVRISVPLVEEYLRLYHACSMSKHRTAELATFLKKNTLPSNTQGSMGND